LKWFILETGKYIAKILLGMVSTAIKRVTKQYVAYVTNYFGNA